MKFTSILLASLTSSVMASNHLGEEKMEKPMNKKVEGEHVVQQNSHEGKAGNPEVVVVLWHKSGGKDIVTETVHEQKTVTQTVTVAADAQPTVIASTTVEPGKTAVVEHAGSTHTVTVGGPQGLTFFPEELSPEVGDIVVFDFLSQNHTVTQSTFDLPCDPMAGGIDSGFVANPNNTVVPPPQVAVQVMDKKPIWMYCAQGNHCGSGMVFSINPTAEKTHAQFKANAIKQKGMGGDSAITNPDNKGMDMAPPPPPPKDEPPKNEEVKEKGGEMLQHGKGQMMPDGSCMCTVQCSVSGGNYPRDTQGLWSVGGTAGAIKIADSVYGL